MPGTCARSRALLVAAFSLLLAAFGAGAADLPRPAGAVILTVQGDIAETNRDGAADFDRAMLEALGTTTLVTVTPWTDGAREFVGVPFERLLDHLGIDDGILEARALNDYSVSLPVADMRAKRALLALRMDGEPLSVRDKGPIWVVFPWGDNPALNDQATKHQSIWQLRTLIVE